MYIYTHIYMCDRRVRSPFEPPKQPGATSGDATEVIYICVCVYVDIHTCIYMCDRRVRSPFEPPKQPGATSGDATEVIYIYICVCRYVYIYTF